MTADLNLLRFVIENPTPPPGGGVLVLNKSQLANRDLMALIRELYPDTKIVESKPLPLVADAIE